jgi:hypothetical protein
MVKASPDSEYINGDWCIKNNVTQVIFLEEPVYQQTDFGMRLRAKVQCNDSARSIKLWTLNKTSEKTLIEFFGDETRNWIGKPIPITVSQTTGKGGNLSLTVYPNKLALQQAMTNSFTAATQSAAPQNSTIVSSVGAKST